MDSKKIGSFIAQLRRENGLTQSELAERLEVTNKAISRWETGRGYPDVELLPVLASALGVSVQELLEGERLSLPEECNDGAAVSAVCSYGAIRRKAQTKKIILISVILSVSLLVPLAALSVPCFFGYYHMVMGSENCVVASDYSSLTYFGQKYIPLPMNGLEGRIGDCMVREAQVEDAPFLGKVIFGESLYEVKNVPDNELVYLQTDHDSCVSQYFVLESEYDRYLGMVNEGAFVNYYFCGEDAEGYIREVPVSTEVVTGITETSGKNEECDGRRFISLYAYDADHVFYRWVGDIYQSDDTYYWSPSEYQERDDVHSGYFMSHKYYRIDSSAYAILAPYIEAFT